VKVNVAWTETWRRTAEIEVDEASICDHFGWADLSSGLTDDELTSYLNADADLGPDGWLYNMPPLDVRTAEFYDLDVDSAEEAS